MTAADSREQRARAASAKEFRTFRQQFLYSQRALADALRISVRCIVNIEAGRTSARRDTLRRFVILQRKWQRETAA